LSIVEALSHAILEALSHANAHRNVQPSDDIRNKIVQSQQKHTRSYVSNDKVTCSKAHNLHECNIFLGMSAEARNTEIKKNDYVLNV